MLLVKTKLASSVINGIGLYADQYIPQGTVIWEFSDGVDLSFSEDAYQKMKQQHDFSVLDKYIYKSMVSGAYILCADDARFINHSNQANTIDTLAGPEGLTLAARDIEINEEITSDYQTFDADFNGYKHLLH